MSTSALVLRSVRAFRSSEKALTCELTSELASERRAPAPHVGLRGPCPAQVVEVLNEDPLTKSLAVLGR